VSLGVAVFLCLCVSLDAVVRCVVVVVFVVFVVVFVVVLFDILLDILLPASPMFYAALGGTGWVRF
jgi:hypothetical protein